MADLVSFLPLLKNNVADSFTIRLEDYEHNLAARRLWLVARYAPGCGGEFWDNNEGKNFRVNFRRARSASPIHSPAGSSLGLVGMFNPSPSPPTVNGLGLETRAKVKVIAEKDQDKEQEEESEVHAQQKTFSAPSTLRTTPMTGALTAHAHGGRHHGHGHGHGHVHGFDFGHAVQGGGATSENVKQRVHGFQPGTLTGAVLPLMRSVSLPTNSSSSSPFSSASGSGSTTPVHLQSGATAAAPTTASYLSRRLSLTNYAKPSTSPKLSGLSGMEMGAEMGGPGLSVTVGTVTPPMTPPGSGRVRSRKLPVSAHIREGAFGSSNEPSDSNDDDNDFNGNEESELENDDRQENGGDGAHEVASPAGTTNSSADSSVVSTPSTVTPTGRASASLSPSSSAPLSPLADFPWSPSSSLYSSLGLGFGFGFDNASKYAGANVNAGNGGLLSPPKSLDSSPVGSGRASPVQRHRSPSPPSHKTTQGSGSPSIASPLTAPTSTSPSSSTPTLTPTPTSTSFGLSIDIPALSSLQTNVASSSTSMKDGMMGVTSPRVDTSDSSYAAFVRQWCFAGAGSSSGGATSNSGSTSDSTSSSSSSATPSPSSASSVGSPAVYTTLGAGTAGGFGGAMGLHQQQQQQRSGHGGYGFPGFGFGMVDAGMVGGEYAFA